MEMLHANIGSDDSNLMSWINGSHMVEAKYICCQKNVLLHCCRQGSGYLKDASSIMNSAAETLRLRIMTRNTKVQQGHHCLFEGGKNNCTISASCSATLAISWISCGYRVRNDRIHELMRGILHWWMSKWVRHRREIGRLGKKYVQTSSSSIRAGSISRLLTWSNDTPC